MSELPPSLSPAGLKKRDAILAAALAESSRLRVKRRVVRGSLAGTAIILVLGGVLTILAPLMRSHPPKQTVTNTPAAPAPSIAPRPPVPAARSQREHEIVITRIPTDPQIASRLAVHTEHISIQRIDDDQLLSELAAASEPAGLAYIAGHPKLLFRGSGNH